jgi:hypothetical protein
MNIEKLEAGYWLLDSRYWILDVSYEKVLSKVIEK